MKKPPIVSATTMFPEADSRLEVSMSRAPIRASYFSSFSMIAEASVKNVIKIADAPIPIDENARGHLGATALSIGYKSINSLLGSSSASFTRTRNVTAPLPSTIRWS